MTIEKAMQRIAWRFGENKSFLPNLTDKEAYNQIAEYVSEKQKKSIVDNELFGRMYIYMLGFMLIKYDATFFDDIPQKELHRILEKPTRQILSDALDTHNQIELLNHLENERKGKYEPMTYEEAAENIRVMVNGAINQYSPKHLESV